jgi:hypothetical protein
MISHTGNDSPNVPIGHFLELAARFRAALPADAVSRLFEALSISDEHREMIAFRNVLRVIPALAGRPGVAE